MHWRKMKIHLKHWANSLEEEGYHADAKYVREELMARIDNDLPIYNERDKPYVIPLLNDLENAIHEHLFDCGYETWYDEGWESGVEWANERGSYK